eukprot:931517-Amphidinium_carterae.1
MISLGFTVLFTVELVFRLYHVRTDLLLFIFGKNAAWNVFDVVVIAALWVEQGIRILYSFNSGTNAVVFQSIRMLKLTRVLRMARSVESLREFNLLMRSLWRSMRSLFWIVTFTCSAGYFTSILLASQTVSMCRDGASQAADDEFCAHFGTLPDLQMSLVQAISGGVLWGELSTMLSRVEIQYKIIFLTFVAFGVIVVFNLATGILLEVHSSCRSRDFDSIKMRAEEQRAILIERIRMLFQRMDASKT